MAGAFDPVHPIVHALQRAWAWNNNIDDQRNQQVVIGKNLMANGISPRHAVPLSAMLAYTPNPDVAQAHFVAALKSLGYLSHQAQ